VDDNPAIHEDIKKILDPQRHGDAELDAMEAELFDDDTPPSIGRVRFEIESAYQGQEALAMLQASRAAGRPYAVAFVDVRMPPGWDGIETISRLWREDPDLQVVICTAYSDHSWSDIVKRLAPTDGLLILRKPFDGVEIRQMAHALTTKWMLRQQVRARLLDLQDQVHTRTAELERTSRELAREAAERQRVENELRLAQKLDALGKVAAGIAHEIATPVQFVGESVTLLRSAFEGLQRLMGVYRALLAEAAAAPGQAHLRETQEAAEREARPDLLEQDIAEGLERTLEGTERITSVVRAMSVFMHPDRREKQPADLNRALSSTLLVARNEYKYVAEVEAQYGELPPVVCHVGDLNQVFLNLIVNAAHAVAPIVTRTRALGRIRVRTWRDGDFAAIAISDTGEGIPEGIRARVFEPFFTTKEAGKGTGQGLAIARAIVVDRHQGTITFDSTAGQGTTFTVRIPIEGR
jgi:signal transduction histidine kinase